LPKSGPDFVANLMGLRNFRTYGGHMKSRLLACAAAGLACTFLVRAGAQVSGGAAGRTYGAFVSGPPAYAGGPRHAVPLDQITANVRAAGLQPLSRPMLRGAVYYVRAVNPPRAEMRVAIDARSGRVLSATRVAHEPPARPASEPGPVPQPYASGRGYSEAPPADLPLENRAMPPGRIPDAPAPKRESAPSPGPAKPVMVPIAPLE
jgi:hypothetical protein